MRKPTWIDAQIRETISEYEMSVIQCPLCTVYGSLYIPADKASLLHATEKQRLNRFNLTNFLMLCQRVIHQVSYCWCHGWTKSESQTTEIMQKLTDIEAAFIKHIEWMMVSYYEGWVVLDCDLDHSVKD